MHAVTEGIDALGEVDGARRATSVDAGRMFGGYGADTDIIVASAQAYLAALNRLLEAQGRGSRGDREIGPRRCAPPARCERRQGVRGV